MAVIVTRSRSLANDVDNDGEADPGDIFLHSIIITNGDATAITNIQLEETEEGYTISPGSVEIGPIAVDDSLGSISGNTPFAFTAAELIGNDLDPDDATPNLTITEIDGTPLVYNALDHSIAVNNGTLVHHGDGTFTFTPTTGFAGAASFEYQVADAQGQTSVDTFEGQVSITVTDPVWYVDSSVGAGGDGSFANPFDSISDLSSGGVGDLDNDNDTIFVYDNGGTAGGTIVLETGQKLFGDSHAFNVNGIDIGNSTDNSAIGGGGTGTIVVLGSGNEIDGIDIVATGTATGLTGSGFGNFTVNNTTIDTADQALSLATGTVLGGGFTSTNSDGGTSNVSLATVAGTVNLGTGTLQGASGSSVNISGGTASVDYNGAISQANNAALLTVTNHATGTVALDGTLNATDGTGLQFDNADGSYNVTGAATLNGGTAGVDILNGSAGTFTFASGAAITHAGAGDAFVVDESNANVTYSGSISDTVGNAVNIDNHDGGTITFQTGTITATGGTGGGIDVTNSNGGTINFNGAVTLNTGANDAVSMTANAGSAINFSGAGAGLDITTTSGTGFAFSGGTLGIAGTGNTVTTGTGAIVSLTGTIAAGGASFASLTGGTTASTAISLSTVTGGTFDGGAVNIAGTSAGNTVSILNTSSAVNFASGSIGSSVAGTDTLNISNGTGAVTIGATLAKSSAGNVVDISGHANGTIDFNGTVSSTGGTSNGISLVNNTGGGDINFDGDVTLNTGANTAFNFTNNQATGSDVRFTFGSLDIDTAGGTGINAQSTTAGAGTLQITGNGNSVTATTGRAVGLEGVHSSGITLHDVSASGGSTTAIYLNNAGSGGFTIAGTSSDAGSGGTINAIAGVDGQTTSGVGVYIGSTNNVSLSNMSFTGNTQNFNILGDNVTNFTLRESAMSAGTTVGTSGVEGNIRFTNLDGVAVFEGNNIEDALSDALAIINTENTTLNLFVRDTSGGDQAVFGLNGNLGNDIINVETQNDASARILVGNVQFTGWRGDAVNTRALGTSNIDVTVEGSQFHNTHGNIVTGGGIGVLVGGTAGGGSWGVDYTIQNNSFRGADGYSIAASFNGNGGTARGFISGNTIGIDDNVPQNIGSINGGIIVRNENSGGAAGSLIQAVTIQNNQIRDVGQSGIKVDSVNTGNTGNPTIVEATITNNIVEEMYDSLANINIAGLWGLAAGAGSDTSQVGLNISGNTFNIDGTTNSYAPVFLQEQSSATARFYLPGYSGPVAPDSAGIEAYLESAPRLNVLTGDPGQIGTPFPAGVFRPDAIVDGNAFTLPAPTGSDTQLPSGAIVAGAPPQQPDEDETPASIPPAPVTEPGGGGSVDPTPPPAPPAPPPPAPPAPPPPAPPAHPVIVDDGVLSQAELDWLAEAAIQRWIDAGATTAQVAAMRATTLGVTDMTGLYLGVSSDGSIRIDSDGGGHGWFLDRTPGDDKEYEGSGSRLTADAGSPAAGDMDLLTVLMHELGHQLGLADDFNLNSADTLMYGRANLGERRLPQADDLVGADLDHPGHESFVLITPTITTLPAGKAVRVEFNSTVKTYQNEVIDNPFENYSRITFSGGSTASPVDSLPEALTIDSLTLSGTIWNDDGAGGGTVGNGQIDGTEGTASVVANVDVSLFVDSGDDDAPDSAIAIATATTDANGIYTFANLAPGNYLVRVDLANFEPGGELVGLQVSPGGDPDPDNDTNNDDNGSRVAGQPAFSRTITLAYNTEPTNDGDADADTNNTLDFAFLNNVSPTLDLNGAAAGDGSTASVTEQSGPATLAPDLTIVDPDDTDLEGATVSITAGFQTDDLLSVAGSFTGTSGTISWTYDFNNGVLDFTGSATLAEYEVVLRQVQTETNGDAPGTSRTVTWTVTDGTSNSNAPTTSVTVTPTDDVPGSTGGLLVAVDEDSVIVLGEADFGFFDPDGHDFAGVRFETAPTGGALFLDADGVGGADPVEITTFPTDVTAADINAGKLTFVLAENLNGPAAASFEFKVMDDGATENVDPTADTSTFNVTAVNDAPIGDDNVLSILEDEMYDFVALDFGFDDPIDGDDFLSITITNAPTNGTLFLDADGVGVGAPALALTTGSVVATAMMDGRFYYVPAADQSGASFDSFDFELTDDGTTANGGVDTSILDYTIDFDVTAVNDAPLLGNLAGDNSSFNEDGAPVLLDAGSDASVSDIDSPDFGGGSLTISIGANGVAAEDVLGIDTSGTVSVVGTTVSVGVTAIGTITGNGLNGNDLVISFNAAATTGLIETLARALTYANTNTVNPDTTARSIEISLVDGDGVANLGGDSVLVTVGAAIVPNDDAAVAGDDAFSLAEDGIATGSLFGNDVDLDGPLLAVTHVNGMAGNVGTTFTLASGARLRVNSNGNYIYDPDGEYDYLAAPGSGAANSPATDTFTYTLANGNTATVTVTITGVDGEDILIGTGGDDIMSGGRFEDRLFGLAGNDQLHGKGTRDFLFGGDGIDTLFGASGHDFLFGGDGNDTLAGGDHGDLLDGGAGADTMMGGIGNDTYVVDHPGDIVIENRNEGRDKAEASIDHDLSDHVEQLNLVGGSHLDGRGNHADNKLFGNIGKNKLDGRGGDDLIDGGAGHDRIYGGGGNDVLIGGAGHDKFHFNTALGPDNVDHILDYTSGQDGISLARYIFTGSGSGTLNPNAFQLGNTALDGNDRILYDPTSGEIFYDADGSGAAAAILFATVTPAMVLTNTDFYLYG